MAPSLDLRVVSDGTRFEQLVRDLLEAFGYRVAWTGKGVDDGRDLVAVEPGDPMFGSVSRKWLVSCKHNAHAGTSVGVNAIGDAPARCKQHGCDGFALACSTVPTSGLLNAFDGWRANERLHFHYWDDARLEGLLLDDRAAAVRAKYFGKPLKWKVAKTGDPHLHVITTNEDVFYLGVRNREGTDDGTGHEALFELGLDHLRKHLPAFSTYKVRGLWYDDKHSDYTWYVDVFHPPKQQVDVKVLENKVSQVIVFPGEDMGQFHWFRFRAYAQKYAGSRDDELTAYVSAEDLAAISSGGDW
jgi:hypothetical protein